MITKDEAEEVARRVVDYLIWSERLASPGSNEAREALVAEIVFHSFGTPPGASVDFV